MPAFSDVVRFDRINFVSVLPQLIRRTLNIQFVKLCRYLRITHVRARVVHIKCTRLLLIRYHNDLSLRTSTATPQTTLRRAILLPIEYIRIDSLSESNDYSLAVAILHEITCLSRYYKQSR